MAAREANVPTVSYGDETPFTSCTMQVCSAFFEETVIDANGHGAGIIPFAVDAHGCVRVLLGRERWTAQWKGSCRWSGFEGTRKPGEALVETAWREYVEESLGVLTEEVRRALDDGDHFRRIVLRIQNDRRSDRFHVTYLVRVAMDEELPTTFRTLRQRIEYLDRLTQEWRYLRPAPLTGLIVGPCEVDVANGTATVRARRGAEECTLELRRDDELDQWFEQRARIERALLDHACVRSVRDEVWDHVQDVTILRDHLEKDQVRWWTLAELQKVIDGRGVYETERFRPYFIPILQTLLAELSVLDGAS